MMAWTFEVDCLWSDGDSRCAARTNAAPRRRGRRRGKPGSASRNEGCGARSKSGFAAVKHPRFAALVKEAQAGLKRRRLEGSGDEA